VIVEQVFGLNALMHIISHFVFIFVAFRTLSTLRLEQFFKRGEIYTTRIRVLLIMISVALGYTVSSFFLDFLTLIKNMVLVNG
jgi:uncharacterized integral membrane protein (TIGR02327 family)